MMTTNKLGLYIHIPFCEKKCRYCDFLSHQCNDSDILSQYAQALIREIRIKSQGWPYREVDSIFIGGGTPSLLSVEDINSIMDAIYEHFSVTHNAEITIEANPATLTDEKLECYLRKGINRLSIGVQSFDNQILSTLGRIHTKNDAFDAFQRAKKIGFENINLDIMFGIPGQNMKAWKDTVRQCIFLEAAHISLYSLQIEEGTEMYRMVYEDYTLKPLSEDEDREMYHEALRMMRTAGYEQYEISNAARPGFESRHNLKYWSYDEYLGIGLGASSFVDKTRFRNCEHMFDYIEAIKASVSPVDAGSVHHYTEKEEMGIYMFTGLRKTEGINLNHFKRKFGKELFEVYDKELLSKYQGKLVEKRGKLFLTEEGMDISNTIMAEFV